MCFIAGEKCNLHDCHQSDCFPFHSFSPFPARKGQPDIKFSLLLTAHWGFRVDGWAVSGQQVEFLHFSLSLVWFNEPRRHFPVNHIKTVVQWQDYLTDLSSVGSYRPQTSTCLPGSSSSPLCVWCSWNRDEEGAGSYSTHACHSWCLEVITGFDIYKCIASGSGRGSWPRCKLHVSHKHSARCDVSSARGVFLLTMTDLLSTRQHLHFLFKCSVNIAEGDDYSRPSKSLKCLFSSSSLIASLHIRDRSTDKAFGVLHASFGSVLITILHIDSVTQGQRNDFIMNSQLSFTPLLFIMRRD